MVNFIDNHQPDLIEWITDVEPVLRDLRYQNLLTQKQYNDVMRKKISYDRMEDLCDMIRRWEDTGKYMAYKVLSKYNEELIEDLEEEDTRRRNNWSYGEERWMRRNPLVKVKAGALYIHKHKQDLVKRIKNVRPVIDDLFHKNLLKREQRDYLMRVPHSEDAMKRLFSIMRHWDDRDMEEVYRILYKHDYVVIDDLKMLESSNLGEPTGFLEKHRLDLISRVIMVDPILDDLRDLSLLEHKQYDLLRRQPSIRKKMTELLDIVSNWEDNSKWRFLTSLCAHNHYIIIDLQRTKEGETKGSDPHPMEVRFANQNNAAARTQRFYTLDSDVRVASQKTEPARAVSYASNPIRNNHGCFTTLDFMPLRGRKHFVDEHCWDLIRRIIMVDPVIDDLWEQNLVTQEQYDALTKLKTPQKKMIDLYDLVRFWPNIKKDQVYLALRQHNPPFIRVLEKSDQKLTWSNANKGSHYQKLTLDLETGSSAGKHFLDKNKSGLINVMTIVDPVVEDLREEGLLTEEQYHNILLKETSKEKMAEIYDITNSFDNVNKDKVYLALRTHNRSHIRVIERISNRSLSVSEQSGDGTKCVEPVYDQEDNQNEWVTPGSFKFTITCSVCMEMYKNPVTLICGHNFCLNCIEKTWNSQDGDDTSCPICRRRFKKRPELNKNLVLCQIAEFCQSSKSDKKTYEHYTYCTHCTSPNNRKCSIHDKILEYYCSQDSACVCAHCCIAGEHKGHKVTPIRQAMETKKDKLRDIEENLNLKKSEIEKSIKICRQKVQEKVYSVSIPGTNELEVQEIIGILKLVQGSLSLEKEQTAVSVEDLIRQLEAKRSHLTQITANIKELCYETDPFIVLQDQEDYNL